MEIICCENPYEKLLANMNFNIYHFAAEYGMGWVVNRNQIAYLKPSLRCGDRFYRFFPLALRCHRSLVEMKMWNERKDKLKSVMWTNLGQINTKKNNL